jgi:hypothetical protein
LCRSIYCCNPIELRIAYEQLANIKLHAVVELPVVVGDAELADIVLIITLCCWQNVEQ